MNQTLPVVITFVALAGAMAPAAAQGVYRCGDSYSQKPCPGGSQVPTDDARSASQRAQAAVDAQRVSKAADAMEKARLKDEAKPAGRYIPDSNNSSATEQPKPKALAKPKKPEYFTAVAPRKPGDPAVKPKKKAKKKEA